MQERLKEVADALVAQINAYDSFAVAFKARRSYRPIYEMGKQTDLEVNVICLEEDEEVMDRDFDAEYEFVVDIGVQQKFARKQTEDGDLELTDKLVKLCQQIGDVLRENQNETLPGLAYRSKTTLVPFSAELLARRQFTGVIELRYAYDGSDDE